MLYPDGVRYDKQNHDYRTDRTNMVFDLIAEFSKRYAENKNGTESFFPFHFASVVAIRNSANQFPQDLVRTYEEIIGIKNKVV